MSRFLVISSEIVSVPLSRMSAKTYHKQYIKYEEHIFNKNPTAIHIE